MNKEFVIYLDMDGVICSFIEAVEAIYPGAKELQKTYYGSNLHSPSPELSKKYQEFTNAILNTPNFWRDLDWTHDGKELVSYIIDNFHINNICILTAPMKHDESRCFIEKKEWISNNIPFINMNNFFLEKNKHNKINSLDGKYQILIDDMNHNIENWRNAGGMGILHKNSKNTIDVLKEMI